MRRIRQRLELEVAEACRQSYHLHARGVRGGNSHWRVLEGDAVGWRRMQLPRGLEKHIGRWLAAPHLIGADDDIEAMREANLLQRVRDVRPWCRRGQGDRHPFSIEL